jgi:putative nucleotidyltransferase with HDIG domain
MSESDDHGSKSASGPSIDFLTLASVRLRVDAPLPGDVYICIRHRMVLYKRAGDSFTRAEYDKLIFNRVKFLFIDSAKKLFFANWIAEQERKDHEETFKEATPEQESVLEATQELRRAALDLFSSPSAHEQSRAAIQMSKKMVTEFLKKPYVVNNITQLQRYGHGCVDHSVNVSVLSVFLGLRMGYSSQVILEHLAVGGLLHDVGKTQLPPSDDGLIDEDDPVFQQHPLSGKAMLEATKEITRDVANEVRMIVAQHHEYLDGSGYPSRLRGFAVYDLARVVTIANVFDDLVSQAVGGNIKDRQLDALDRLEKDYEGKLDPKKLEKALKIIRTSIM